MDISSLQHNAEIVHSALVEKGNTLVAKKDCKIYIPESYFSRYLAVKDDTLKIVGIFGIVVGDKHYAASVACSLMEITPTNTNVVTIEDEKYMEYQFDAGDVICPNINLVCTKTFLDRVYAEFVDKGRVPWYIDYDTALGVFETAKFHSNINLGIDQAITELIVASTARNSKDRSKFYRHGITKGLDRKKRPDYIPLSSVALSATNTTAKLLGNNIQEGITSALVNPSERNEPIEDLLR